MLSFDKHTVLLIGTILSHLIPSIMAQCNETEFALLKVSYFTTKDKWYNLDDMRLSVRPSGNTGNSSLSETVDYYSVEDLVDFERCVPREGTCLEVTVAQLPSNSYEISWDGLAIDTGPEFKGEYRNFTSTEVGDHCFPVCSEDTEALFEYQYQASIGFEDYRVEDKDGNIVLGCDSSTDKCQMDYYNSVDSLHTNRACLKKNACYRFLIGDNFQRIPGYHDDLVSVYSLRWNDEFLVKSVSKLFDSIKFGDSCGPDCNQKKESSVEFFMHRISSSGSDCENDPDFPWELKVLDPESKSWSMDSSGVVPGGCSDTSLYYESICVPKDRCSSFSISSPEAPEFVAPLYTLTMDGVIFKRKEMWNRRHIFSF